MRYRIYKNSRGYFIKYKNLGVWFNYKDYMYGIEHVLYYGSLKDAIREIEKIEIDKKPKLVKEL